MEIDLQQFCIAPGSLYKYLEKPFSRGEFTYATNGHIMVRVPKIEGVGPPDTTIPITVEKPLEGIEQAAFAVPVYTLPPAPVSDTECKHCDGTGHEHDCPDCECECDACDGTGKERIKQSTTFDGVNFDLRYVRMMLALPGIEVAPAKEEKLWWFRFTGGVGALMSMRSASDHVDVFTAREDAACVDHAISDPAPAEPDDWIEWKGGECPVGPDVRVDFRLRDDGGIYQAFARNLRWGTYVPFQNDIIAYRLAKTEGAK